jgi:NAD(P)-dependent dehydrogenase (short-subunit alcohol dehydrogenase family)
VTVDFRRFSEKYGPWALVAGASMGIGAALSHEAARRGLNVLMLARGVETLEDTATAVREAHAVETRTLQQAGSSMSSSTPSCGAWRSTAPRRWRCATSWVLRWWLADAVALRWSARMARSPVP